MLVGPTARMAVLQKIGWRRRAGFAYIPRLRLMRRSLRVCAVFLTAWIAIATAALATSNYEYGADEYVTIAKGISPDEKYAITAHGEGELGDENFHIFLTDAVTGEKLGPLEEIVEPLDTGADAFCAKWSPDSQHVVIVYRIDRHEPLKAVSYEIKDGKASLVKGPVNATKEQTSYWSKECSESKPSEKIFGTPKKHSSSEDE